MRLAAHHGNSLRAENLGDAEGGVEGDIGEDVHHRHQDAGDGDGAGKVPHRVLRDQSLSSAERYIISNII